MTGILSKLPLRLKPGSFTLTLYEQWRISDTTLARRARGLKVSVSTGLMIYEDVIPSFAFIACN
jgi:hypothetical protein